MGNDPISEHELRRLLEHEAWIRRLAKSLVADENRANELIQHVLTEALKNPPRNPKPWITVVMRAAAWRMRRSESRRKQRENAVARKEAGIPAVPNADQSETRERLVGLVQEMESSYREVLVLHFFEDLTLEEIARRKGVPSATMRTRLRRALAQLREKLRAHYGDPSRWVFSLLPISGIRHLSELGTTAGLAKGKSALAVGSKVLAGKSLLGAAAVVLSGSAAIALVASGTNQTQATPEPKVAFIAPSDPGQAPAFLESAEVPALATVGPKKSASMGLPGATVAPLAEEIPIFEDAPAIAAFPIEEISATLKPDGSVVPSDPAIPIPPSTGGNWNKKKNDPPTAPKTAPNQAPSSGKKGKKKNP